jgi:DNA-binding LacI/PurR family transcriptional regulator
MTWVTVTPWNRFQIGEVMAAATIRDVADRAGVGVGTVSRLVNGGRQVHPRTAERVQAAIDELGYLPSRRGRAFARGRTASVAVLVPFVTHPSAVERVTGLVEGFRSSGLPVSLADVESPEHQHEHLEALSSDLRPEGLVVVSLRLTREETERLRASGVRPVLIDAEAEGLTSFVVDDLAGGRLAVEHLLGLGHESVAFVGDLEHDRFGFVSSELRHRGYVAALDAAGLERCDEYERTGHHGQDTARNHGRELFGLARRPTAVFAASDTQALGILQAARDVRLRVPEDVSVVGFDDIAVAALTGLTTVRQPLVESGLRAAEAVLAQVDDPERAPEQVVLPLHLVVRDTTAPPPRPRSRHRPGARTPAPSPREDERP